MHPGYTEPASLAQSVQGVLDMNDQFRHLAHAVSAAVGSPWAAVAALGTVLLWLLSGPFFGYSDHWQLIINTGTTIVTFLMVFLIQNAQNRDARAIHLKLDELIRGVKGARNALLNLEECTDAELEKLHLEFQRLRERHQRTQQLQTQGEQSVELKCKR
jgi:low affinity Fe/Cu permease